jgi:hypothetical protein
MISKLTKISRQQIEIENFGPDYAPLLRGAA